MTRIGWKFTYSLRLFLAIVFAIAIITAWWTERARRQKTLRNEVVASGGVAMYTSQWNAQEISRALARVAPERPTTIVARLQRDHPEYFFDICMVQIMNRLLDEQAKRSLPRLSHLTWLELSNTDFEDADLARLACEATLAFLDCHDTSLTDVGARDLVRFEKLLTLNLKGTNITDAGLQHLARLSKLRELYLDEYGYRQPRPPGHRLTDHAVAQLQNALPYCSINGVQAPGTVAIPEALTQTASR